MLNCARPSIADPFLPKEIEEGRIEDIRVGWVLLLDYFFIPMVIALITAKAFEVLIPGISFRVWILMIATFATGVNLLGIKVADRVNLAIMAAQLAAMAGLAVV